MQEGSPPFPGGPLQLHLPATLQLNIWQILLTDYGRLASPGLTLCTIAPDYSQIVLGSENSQEEEVLIRVLGSVCARLS